MGIDVKSVERDFWPGAIFLVGHAIFLTLLLGWAINIDGTAVRINGVLVPPAVIVAPVSFFLAQVIGRVLRPTGGLFIYWAASTCITSLKQHEADLAPFFADKKHHNIRAHRDMLVADRASVAMQESFKQVWTGLRFPPSREDLRVFLPWTARENWRELHQLWQDRSPVMRSLRTLEEYLLDYARDGSSEGGASSFNEKRNAWMLWQPVLGVMVILGAEGLTAVAIKLGIVVLTGLTQAAIPSFLFSSLALTIASGVLLIAPWAIAHKKSAKMWDSLFILVAHVSRKNK